MLASDTFVQATGLGCFACFFADGPATTNVTATVTDSDGATDTDNQVVVVTVNNVAPTVTLSGANDLSVNEGTSHTYSFTTSDPGEDDFALLSTDCGLNGSQVGLATFNTVTGAGSFVCSFPDGPASSNVSVQVEDSDGADSNIASQTVAIANVAPTVTLTGDATANEGTSHTYSSPSLTRVPTRSCSTPPTAASTAARSDPTPSTRPPAPAASTACSPTARPSSTVSVTVSDSDGASDSDSLTVAIANVAPTVTLTGSATANEGDTKTYSFTVSDPGADTFVLDATECGLNGTQVGPDTFNSTTGAGSFDCSFPDGPASSTVSVTVSDSDGASDSDSLVVAISNVKPTVVLSGDASADEGTTHTYTYTVSDPGDDTLTIVESCGANGSLTDTAAPDSFDCTFPDGPAARSCRSRRTTRIRAPADGRLHHGRHRQRQAEHRPDR